MAKRIAISVEAAFVLFLVSMGVALFVLRRAPDLTFAVFMLVLFVPALASVLLAFFAASFRSLLAEPKVGFPVTVTFPLVHVALMLAIIRIVATTSSALETLPVKLAPAVIWQHWAVLLSCILMDFVALNILSALGRGS